MDPPTAVREAGWQRLDPRMLAVTPLRQLFGFLPLIFVVLLVGGQDLDERSYGLLIAVVAVVIAGMLRWFTTRYRITGERVELNHGLLFRTSRSVPRDRIRSVDLTAGPFHRLFRLSVVKIGTGEHTVGTDSRELTLDAVSSAEADRLRHHLLNRPDTGSPHGTPGVDGTGVPVGTDVSDDGDTSDTRAVSDNRAVSDGRGIANGRGVADGTGVAQRPGVGASPEATTVTAPPVAPELARLQWSWLRFAPLTVSSLAAVGAVIGVVFQFVGELGVDPADVMRFGVDRQLSDAPLWLGITVFALLLSVIAVLGALLIFVEAWWGFRLVREPGGTLRIRRGLFTARSISLEERRLRGVEVAEPLLLRLGRGARLTAVATGLGGSQGQSRGALLPPAPREEAHRVAGLVLDEVPDPTLAPLRRHPVAALRRRLWRAVLPVLLGSAVLFLTPVLSPATVPAWAGWVVLGLLPITLLLAADAYRNLGHGLTERYLVTRHGAGVRRTAALQRSGVIGWTVSQSLLQRRVGLITLTATTAAGNGAYHVLDVQDTDGLVLAEQAVPGLLRPFLHIPEHDAANARSVPG